MIRNLQLFVTLLIAAVVSLDAAARPALPPKLSAIRLSVAPVIDGDVLGDEAWSDIVPASEFWQVQPDDGEPATQRTEVFVGYTDTALHIGVIAYDEQPGEIIVSDSRRDADLANTDAFFVVIDGLLDRQNGYVFATNAAGIEYDGQVTKEGSDDFGSGGGGFNRNWDGAWSVKSTISDTGWSAEFEIPFRTLRYSLAAKQDWGINFQRNIRRNNEIAYWAPLERNRNLYRVSEAGILRGIEPPPQRNFKITPYVLGQARRGGELTGTEKNSDIGFDTKYSINPSLTLDLTYNTDFAQVEADEEQINLDRFNLFFPEKRPFFLENAGQFSVGNGEEVEMFFSRRIGIGDDGDPIAVEGGARLSGKLGDRTNIGLLYMRTDAVTGIAPANDFAVLRVNRELRGRSAIGAIFVNRDGDGSYLLSPSDYNRTFAVDGRWGFGDNLLLQGWLAKTKTPGRSGRDDAFSVKADWSSAGWSFGANYTEVGEDFNPEVGFLARSEYRKANLLVFRRVRMQGKWGLFEARPHASYTGFWKFDGFQETGVLHLDSHWEYKSGTEIHTGLNLTRAGVIDSFEIIDGVVIQPGTYDHEEVVLAYFGDESKPLSFNIRTIAGGQFGGNRVSISSGVNFRIAETFQSEVSFNYNDFDLPVPNGQFTANLARLRLSYSFTPKVQLQALVQYNETSDDLGTNIRFSWLRSANSGLYLVYNEVDERAIGGLPTGREFILKYSHIFDVFN
ncbi:MAG: carbohydrate binding family 9 domain-containing protein [Gammaproteobacteria bacterium]|nr:carbohydrate binding family 9 domain-containing protein [Gammaproteobacteria bacterium]